MTDPCRQIADCRKDMAAMAQMWRAVAGRSAAGAKVEAEALVFNQMVVALHARFGANLPHIQITLEMRLLAEGISGDGRFPDDARWRPDASVTGYWPGDRIALSEEVFSRLSEVYLTLLARLVEA